VQLTQLVNFEAPEKLFSMGTKLAPWTTLFASS
jgi:hypothetical protein